MALNFPSCSIFSTFVHSDEESYLSRCERNQSFNYPFLSGWESGNYYGCFGGDIGSSDMECACDPVDLLPDDPFGMGLDGDMGAAIADFLEANGRDFFRWTLFCSPETQVRYGGRVEECDVLPEESFIEMPVHKPQYEHSDSGFIMTEALNTHTAEKAHSSGGDEGLPHEGLLFSLAYLGIRDLLSVERVCRSFRFAVQNDSLLWRSIHIDPRLSHKITDEALLLLTGRAQGDLQSLSLFGCIRITDVGLKRVLDNNPKLRKLSVAGCVRLSLSGIINNLRVFQSQGVPGIEHLKLGALFRVSEEQFGELKSLLGIDNHQPKAQKPKFYHTGRSSPGFDDDRVLDIELCPLCQKYKLVYDCPSESCQGCGPMQCRACNFCIARCVECGKCIKNCRYVETFCLEYLCVDCWGVPLLEDSCYGSNEEN
ncbi:hypothetical protein Cni_G09623 [Canna indica]|uniref:F-box domain-containing protein n=1 Tax=Canna indica TaxID=4628 RepID=A0AAQ3K2Q1_9LILI|nr:hypothetical protein Cni_G09623 [Canna indica]